MVERRVRELGVPEGIITAAGKAARDGGRSIPDYLADQGGRRAAVRLVSARACSLWYPPPARAQRAAVAGAGFWLTGSHLAVSSPCAR